MSPMNRLKLPGRSAAISTLLACIPVFLALRAVAAASELPQVAAHPQRRAAAADIPWLIASDDEPWTVALAAPIAAHLGKSGPSPLVMALTNPPTREADWLLSLTSGRRPIVLAVARSRRGDGR
ncbi:MAG: hypothetical protein ABSG53_26995 [Thermoguttaceae bacterium]